MSAIFAGSMIFIAIAVVGSIFFGFYARARTVDITAKGSNACIAVFSVILSCICMWIMWVCAYMHQMNPIIMPLLKTD
ncbi:ATP synthase subunit H (macronuclear) [Tetrahymena thermophila SB210]|uniref:ATP synthase subunit H n=1 Tax=Tetrahymena thermophila (strain SB210) TaxID=312017 RepID=I7MA44_TETTS|nr:ATP synthase subunit H [Tetrahymena thermophila SB210]EAS03687.2 ATP synthase subunit H [Tetrahymena thermophila SB210]|eukprot:XP_001023932.2 ATP synthase subunit H [Tetrahymena thermophila SB210]